MTFEEVVNDPSVHNFTKKILWECLEYDPIDAFLDLRLATETWRLELLKIETYQNLERPRPDTHQSTTIVRKETR